MLKWMCGETIGVRVRNENIRKMIGVVPIEGKLRKNRLRWFGHVQQRPVDATTNRSGTIMVDGNAWGGKDLN